MSWFTEMQFILNGIAEGITECHVDGSKNPFMVIYWSVPVENIENLEDLRVSSFPTSRELSSEFKVELKKFFRENELRIMMGKWDIWT